MGRLSQEPFISGNAFTGRLAINLNGTIAFSVTAGVSKCKGTIFIVQRILLYVFIISHSLFCIPVFHDVYFSKRVQQMNPNIHNVNIIMIWEVGRGKEYFKRRRNCLFLIKTIHLMIWWSVVLSKLVFITQENASQNHFKRSVIQLAPKIRLDFNCYFNCSNSDVHYLLFLVLSPLTE